MNCETLIVYGNYRTIGAHANLICSYSPMHAAYFLKSMQLTAYMGHLISKVRIKLVGSYACAQSILITTYLVLLAIYKLPKL